MHHHIARVCQAGHVTCKPVRPKLCASGPVNEEVAILEDEQVEIDAELKEWEAVGIRLILETITPA